MTRYFIQLRNRILVKGYEFLFFAKNMGKNIGKTLRGKYSKEFFDHAKQSFTNARKTVSNRAIKKNSTSNW